MCSLRPHPISFYVSAHPLYPPSFPTRRSSDLQLCVPGDSDTHQQIAMPAEVFGRTVNHHIGAMVQRPLDHGADVVIHSATKYLSGHSDLLMGVAITRDAELQIGRASCRERGWIQGVRGYVKRNRMGTKGAHSS